MQMEKPLIAFRILSSNNSCSCGGTWTRKLDLTLGMPVPVCGECGDAPTYYRLKKVCNYRTIYLATTSKGKRLESIAAAIQVAKEAEAEILSECFNPKKYNRKRPTLVTSTLSDFIMNNVIKSESSATITLPEKEFMEDYMVPFFSEVGAFVACRIHLEDFIKTFRLKDEREGMARRLFDTVMGKLTQERDQGAA